MFVRVHEMADGTLDLQYYYPTRLFKTTSVAENVLKDKATN